MNKIENPPRAGRWVKSGKNDAVGTVDSSSSAEDYTKNTAPNQPAKPQVEILLEPPVAIKRPLVLLDGQSYAVTILDVQTTVTESKDGNGKIHKYKTPKVSVEQHRIVVRGDGAAFGDIQQEQFTNLANLGIRLELPELPPHDKLWTAKGVTKFLGGYRPDPIDVFKRVKEVVNTFIDFDHSLADQELMGEFMACYVLSTWFLDAFNVIGFLWPNGERGSGKTNLLILVAELSYLGQLILAGGSYASLRDMADCGATLCFDDAENLSDPKQSDPDKRALLLAGNRRGTYVSLKEQTNNKGWRTRFVNTYCPRAFSAIRLPDSVLASRTIIIPLIRTPDRKRANTDPADYIAWPCNRNELVDDLWALALDYLPDLKIWDDWVGENATPTGRNLQPWRSILAVAAWLDKIGVEGLWQRMDTLAISYQTERLNIETSDFTVLIIRAIIRCANNAICAVSANEKKVTNIILLANEVAQKACEIIEEEDADISKDYITPRSVGRVMAKLRLLEVPRPGGQGHRRRSITLRELARLAQSYEIPLPEELSAYAMQDSLPTNATGINGTNGSNGTGNESKKACYACGKKNWVEYPDGSGVFCGTCHPVVNK